MTEPDLLQRAENVAAVLDNVAPQMEPWERNLATGPAVIIRTLVARVSALTDAGNALVKALAATRGGFADGPWDAIAAITAWRALTTDEGAE